MSDELLEHGRLTTPGALDDVDALRARAEAAETRLAEHEQKVARLQAILALHNQTPSGRTRKCLPGCLACAAIAGSAGR